MPDDKKTDSWLRVERYAAWLVAGLQLEALLFLAGGHYIFVQERWIFENVEAIAYLVSQGSPLSSGGFNFINAAELIGNGAATAGFGTSILLAMQCGVRGFGKVGFLAGPLLWRCVLVHGIWASAILANQNWTYAYLDWTRSLLSRSLPNAALLIWSAQVAIAPLILLGMTRIQRTSVEARR